jgi:hypothetical protein
MFILLMSGTNYIISEITFITCGGQSISSSSSSSLSESSSSLSFSSSSSSSSESSSSSSLSSSSSTTEPLYYLIDRDLIDENLTDFPVGIIIPESLEFVNAVNWQYLHVTVSGGVELYTEVELWDGKGIIWTKLPWIPSDSNTLLTLYFDDLNTSHVGLTTTSAAQQVWTNDYVAVYHFSPSGALPTSAGEVIYDSTVNQFHGTPYSTILNTSASFVSGGRFGQAMVFDGKNDYVSVPISASSDSWSFEYYIYHIPGNVDNDLNIFFFDTETGRLTMASRKDSVYGSYYFDGSWKTLNSSVPSGAWSYIAYTFNDGNSDVKYYEDGSLINTLSTYTPREIGGDTVIGARFNGAISFTTTNYSELFISRIPRSDAWIKAMAGLYDGTTVYNTGSSSSSSSSSVSSSSSSVSSSSKSSSSSSSSVSSSSSESSSSSSSSESSSSSSESSSSSSESSSSSSASLSSSSSSLSSSSSSLSSSSSSLSSSSQSSSSSSSSFSGSSSSSSSSESISSSSKSSSSSSLSSVSSSSSSKSSSSSSSESSSSSSSSLSSSSSSSFSSSSFSSSGSSSSKSSSSSSSVSSSSSSLSVSSSSSSSSESSSSSSSSESSSSSSESSSLSSSSSSESSSSSSSSESISSSSSSSSSCSSSSSFQRVDFFFLIIFIVERVDFFFLIVFIVIDFLIVEQQQFQQQPIVIVIDFLIVEQFIIVAILIVEQQLASQSHHHHRRVAAVLVYRQAAANPHRRVL